MSNVTMTVKELDSCISQAVKTKKKKKVTISKNLIGVILPSGKCTLSVRIRNGKSEKLIFVGYYKEMRLEQAQKKANEIVRKFGNSRNFSQAKVKENPLFGGYSDSWKETKKANPDIENGHKTDDRYDTVKSLLKHLRGLSNYHLDEITPNLVDQVLSEHTELTQGTKHRSIEILNECLNSAVVEGLIDVNHCKNMLKSTSALSIKYRAPKVKGYKWVEPEVLRLEFFEKIEECGKLKYRYFWLVLAFSGLRVGSLRHLKWEWIDYENKVIHIPGFYMKMGRDFDLPITLFIETLLNNWKKYCIDNCCLSKYVFFANSSIDKPISEAGLQEYIRENTKMHMHGVRKSLNTWLAKIGIEKHIRDAVISHGKGDPLEEVYNKHDYAEEKRSALRLWGYFIYEYQLTESLKDMLHDINQNVLQIYKNDYDILTQHIVSRKNKLY